jgi:hypothetical protein
MIRSLALVSLLPLLMAQSAVPARFVVAKAPDLMIKTRHTVDHDDTDVVTEVLYLKGARQRREVTSEGPAPRLTPGYGTNARQTHTSISISRCDERRSLMLHPAAKTYVYQAIHDSTAVIPPRSSAAPQPPPVRGVAREAAPGSTLTITFDAVDTGERRQYGSYVARRVISTRTTEPGPNVVNHPATVRREDGWYIDVPPPDCIEWAGSHTASLFVASSPADTVQFKHRGTARRGYPIAVTDRMTGGRRDSVRTIELIEISDAPLDDALFAPPPDYRAALQRPDGSYDLSRPDTLMNRVDSYRELAAAWADYLLRNGLRGILPGTQPPARY